MLTVPSYDSRGLVNLVCELERRMVGTSPSPGLSEELALTIPEAETYVLVLFDGLGVAQLGHPKAGTLAQSNQGTLDAPFPTTTSVSLSTVATGLPPSQHGLVAHLAWFGDLDLVVNTLKWVDLTGNPVPYDYPSVLPGPNLWERLRSAGIEPITVQPGPFQGSPLSRLLYRGARFEPAFDTDDLIEATVQLAGSPRRFVFTYVWQVDFAGHVYGLESDEFAEAVDLANNIWERIASQLPPGAAIVGTADHGLIEYRDKDKLIVRDERFADMRFAGDTRGIHLWGSNQLAEQFAETTGGRLVDPTSLLGPGLTPEARDRIADQVLLAPTGKVVLPPGFDKRLRCYHGGLDRDEVAIPLLVG
jgi:hypothetical protein